jgi:mannose-6-phosphate isomerase-like protein (cupin superfamily)
MRRIVTILFLCSLVPLWATNPPGVAYWSGTTLKDLEKKLSPKINAQKVATEQLGNFGNHSFMVVHRQGDGEAEIHESQVDIFVVQTGQASVIVGGTVMDGKSTGPGETRGSSIQGGEKKSLEPGDVMHIPAKTPHQVLVPLGKQLTYLIVKVDAK